MAQISADTMPIMNRHAAYDTSGYGTKSLDRCDQKGSQTIIRRVHPSDWQYAVRGLPPVPVAEDFETPPRATMIALAACDSDWATPQHVCVLTLHAESASGATSGLHITNQLPWVSVICLWVASAFWMVAWL